MSVVKRDDRVRVEFEGVVKSAHSDQDVLNCWDVEVEVAAPGRAGGSLATYVRHEHVCVTEPAYEVGGLYIDGVCMVWRRGRGCWYRVNDQKAAAYMDGTPVRPLTRLVPEK